MRRLALAALALLALSLAATPAFAQRVEPTKPMAEIAAADLPKEARTMIALIRKGGPYPYAKDGAIFGNREARLPKRARGHYHEYTVKTPGERTRGARRIVSGSAGELYYTNDHYATFRRVRE